MERLTPYRTYWIAWLVLLGLTTTMVFAEGSPLSQTVTVVVVVLAMLGKVALIGGWYMHLRYERLSLVLSVVIGTLATAAVLFFLLIPDGIAMNHLAS